MTIRRALLRRGPLRLLPLLRVPPLLRLPPSLRLLGLLSAVACAPQYGGCGIVSVSIGGRDLPALSEYPRSGPPLQQQVRAIAGVSWPVEPGTPIT